MKNRSSKHRIMPKTTKMIFSDQMNKPLRKKMITHFLLYDMECELYKIDEKSKNTSKWVHYGENRERMRKCKKGWASIISLTFLNTVAFRTLLVMLNVFILQFRYVYSNMRKVEKIILLKLKSESEPVALRKSLQNWLQWATCSPSGNPPPSNL